MENGTPFTVEKISPRVELELGTSRSAIQRLSHGALSSKLPGLLRDKKIISEFSQNTLLVWTTGLMVQ